MAGPRGGLEENPGLDRTPENEARRSDKAGFHEGVVQNISRGLPGSEIYKHPIAANRTKRAIVKRLLQILIWTAVAGFGAVALGTIAFHRGEPINATWFVLAAVCSYLVAYRLYSAFIAAKLLALDNTRATPAERRDDGRDFVPTNKW